MPSENRITFNLPYDSAPNRSAASHIEQVKARQTVIDQAMTNPQFLEDLAIPELSRGSQLAPTIPSDGTYTIHPPPSYIPSNPRAPTAPDRVLYINGMRVDSEGIRRDLRQIAACFGRTTTAVINPPERPLFKYDADGFTLSLRNAVGGFFSTSLGMALERDTIASLIEEVKQGVLQREERILLLAHSQGSIIAGNALEVLLAESGGLTDEERDAIRTNITITVVGAAQRRFPSGIESEELAHAGDVVPRITAPVSYVQHGVGIGVQTVKEWLAGYKQQWEVAKRAHDALPHIPSTEWADKVVLSGGHSLQNYLDNLHLFFIERAKGTKGSINSALLADRFVRSVWQGEYSDIVYCRIVKNRVESGDVAFAKHLVARCTSAGTVGNFKVPILEQLKELSCRTPNQSEESVKPIPYGKVWYESVKNWVSSVVRRGEGRE